MGLTSENIELVPENIQETDIAVSCVSGVKKCSFFGKFDMLCFLETTVLRFAVLPYYRRCQTKKQKCTHFWKYWEQIKPSVVNNKHLQRQTDFLWLRVVPGTKSFSETSRPSKVIWNILIFTDSIPKTIRNRELNSSITNGKTKKKPTLKLNFTLFRRSFEQFICWYRHIALLILFTTLFNVGRTIATGLTKINSAKTNTIDIGNKNFKIFHKQHKNSESFVYGSIFV